MRENDHFDMISFFFSSHPSKTGYWSRKSLAHWMLSSEGIGDDGRPASKVNSNVRIVVLSILLPSSLNSLKDWELTARVCSN